IDPYFADAAGSYSSSVSSYRNVPGAATALTPPPAELELDGLPYAFAGWSFKKRGEMPEGQEPPIKLTGNSIPYRAFQGKVQLYAQYTISLESVKVKYVFSQSGTSCLPAANKVKEKATDTTGYDSGKEFTVSVADIQAGTAKVAVLSCPGYTYMDGSEEKGKVFAGWSLPSSGSGTVDFSAGSSPAALTMAALADRNSTTNTLELTAVFLDATAEEMADIWKKIEYDDTVYAARDTYHVYTAQQLNFLCGKTIDSEKTVLLEDDISLAGTTNKFFRNNFRGTLDGGQNHHTVTIELSGTDQYFYSQGLIAVLDSGGLVKNLTVEGSIASGGRWQGGIAGTNDEGTIENCTSLVRIEATPGSGNYTGGIAGFLPGGTISDCTFSGVITGGAEYIGGIAGIIRDGGAINSSTFSGSITATGYAGSSAYAGKIIGGRQSGTASYSGNTVSGTLTRSESEGSVTENTRGY
ncbi:MAG TPA: hypothetical protein DDW78_04690, partial [Treponema sp.]|nr:hypothetical protein [Treponema sp.]